MAAAMLANGSSLLRVVVPKPLLLQTAQLLHARLGGLLGRELRHIPFSRKTPTTSENVKLFIEIHKDIQNSAGVMLALPEHLLSFMLSGLQRLSDGRIPEAKAMIDVSFLLLFLLFSDIGISSKSVNSYTYHTTTGSTETVSKCFPL